MQLRMKPHQWMATFGLLGLVLATALGLILTREPEQSISNAGQAPGGEALLIDEHPLQPARALATLASGSDEQRLAQQAMKVADRGLDLAFASGLRDAAEHSAPSKPETKELYARASQAQARVKADQERIDQLTKQLPSASGDREANLQQQIDLAHAQHEYDQDELDDVNEDLERSGGDPLSRIQRQFNHHELAVAYSNWIELVRSHELPAVHGMLWSFLLIALILLAVYIAGRIVDHFIIDVKHEWTRLKTLRVVIRFVIQAVGVLLILFVLFGIPNQMPTILGLAGAGLTVALKDFIVAFVGWFVLMGRNGVRVGDWVEINGVVGEVVEINLLRTVLLETGNWTDTGHPTGRKVAFVNSYAIEGHFFNFSTSGQWLWDEVEIMVPSSEN